MKSGCLGHGKDNRGTPSKDQNYSQLCERDSAMHAGCWWPHVPKQRMMWKQWDEEWIWTQWDGGVLDTYLDTKQANTGLAVDDKN